MKLFFVDLLKLFFQILFLLGAVLVAIWFYFRLRKNHAPERPEAESDGLKLILSVKLQASERLILFLERISLNSLILRVQTSDMTVPHAQSAMIRTVREEFEYNQSQQLYVSAQTWEKIRQAKEETIRLINTAASNLKEEATSRDLASAVLQLYLSEKVSPVANAIEAIKNEIK